MSPSEEKIGGWGETSAKKKIPSKILTKEKISPCTMINKAVGRGQTDFHLMVKEKTFIDLPKIPANPFAFLMVHPLYVITSAC